MPTTTTRTFQEETDASEAAALESLRGFVDQATAGLLTADRGPYGRLILRTADGSPLPPVDEAEARFFASGRPITGIMTSVSVGYRRVDRRHRVILRELRDAIRSILVTRYGDTYNVEAFAGFELRCGLR